MFRSLSLFVSSVLISISAFASPGVYVLPLQPYATGGYGVMMNVNHQGPFLCEIDTGSTNLMVPGDAKTCPTCHANPGITPSADEEGSPFRVTYGSGRILNAVAYSTDVQPYTTLSQPVTPAVTQTMGLVTSVSGNLNSAPILGMAQPESPMKDGLTTYMSALQKAQMVPDLGFMLMFCPNQLGSEMVLGGVDPRLQGAMPQTVPLLTHYDHYEVAPASVAIPGGQAIPFSTPYPAAIVDSGNQHISLPSDVYTALQTEINSAAEKNNLKLPAGFWLDEPINLSAAQIALLPDLNITFANGVTLSIPARFYVVQASGDPTKHVLMIRSTGGSVALGDPVMAAYAVLYDRSTESISFYSNAGMCH